MHANARLAPLMRAEIAFLLSSQKLSGRSVALAYSVSDRTVRRWLARARESGFPPRLEDRPSVPHHQPRKTSRQLETRILELRRQRRTYAQILTLLPVSKATLSRILRRHGLNRLSALEPPKPPVLRYERDAPGDLVHVDIKKLGKVPPGGGWRVHGRNTATRTAKAKRAKIGFSYVHSAVDDHSRLAYSEIHDDEKAVTCTAFWKRAQAFFESYGITVHRVLTDNGKCYRSNDWITTLTAAGITPKYTKPYRPQTNGKVERFNRTLLEEWAYVGPYRSEAQRRRRLDKWLHTYNHHRCHTALGGHPPVSRVNNLTGHYT